MNIAEARSLVFTYLYPNEFKLHRRDLQSLLSGALIEERPFGRAVCTPLGVTVALRQMMYILSTRGLTIKGPKNKRLEKFFDEDLQELRCES